MNNLIKGVLILALLIYIISPADLMIGPIDDVIAAIIGVAALKTRVGIE